MVPLPERFSPLFADRLWSSSLFLSCIVDQMFWIHFRPLVCRTFRKHSDIHNGVEHTIGYPSTPGARSIEHQDLKKNVRKCSSQSVVTSNDCEQNLLGQG